MKYSLQIIIAFCYWLCASPVAAVSLDEHPKLLAIANQLIAEKQYSRAELEIIFDAAKIQQSVLDAMQNPPEYHLTWGKYRKLFLQQDRILQGVEFWQSYAEPLARAEQQYGVPSSIIVAIIGVESKFGKHKGKHKVLDSLVTLVLGFERRSKFFATELKEFLILTKKNHLQTDTVLGSYAGAMGLPQFISSSYRNYAVDFSGDGVIDLINQPEDAIGSVANYFIKNGWQVGQPISSPAHRAVAAEIAARASNRRKVQHTAVTLRALGAPIAKAISDTEKLGIVKLNASEVVPASGNRREYIVRAGDTACQVAEAHGIACKTLFKLNKLDNKGTIFRGQRLQLAASEQPIQTVDSSLRQTEAAKQKWQISANTNPGDKNDNASEMNDEDAENMPRYFFTHENFYVITRYNQSVLYAMAVTDLSAAIADAREKSLQLSGGVSQ